MSLAQELKKLAVELEEHHLSWLIQAATMSDIERKIPNLLTKYFKNYSEEDANELLEQIVELDPTRGKYVGWLCQQLKNKSIRLPEDSDNLKDALIKFNKFKPRLDQKDIFRYTPPELSKALEPFEEGVEQSKRKEKEKGRGGEFVVVPGSKKVLSKPPYDVLEVTTPEAASTLSSGTKWCTANLDDAKEYLRQGPLYLVYKNKKRFVLIHYESSQFMDVYNEAVEAKLQFELIELLEPTIHKGIKDFPGLAYDYAKDVIKGRWPEGEETILKDPNTTLNYAKDVIKGRWPEGEETILKDPFVTHSYAREIIKGRWPEGEEIIVKELNAAIPYAKDVIKGRWPELEEIIKNKKIPSYAYAYARDVIKGRWPEVEEIIREDPFSACAYAENIIKGRWPEGEEAIKKETVYALDYAINVLKDIWPEGEEAIKEDPYYYRKYLDFISKLPGAKASLQISRIVNRSNLKSLYSSFNNLSSK